MFSVLHLYPPSTVPDGADPNSPVSTSGLLQEWARCGNSIDHGAVASHRLHLSSHLELCPPSPCHIACFSPSHEKPLCPHQAFSLPHAAMTHLSFLCFPPSNDVLTSSSAAISYSHRLCGFVTLFFFFGSRDS